jgi:hypothetical protein
MGATPVPGVPERPSRESWQTQGTGADWIR